MKQSTKERKVSSMDKQAKEKPSERCNKPCKIYTTSTGNKGWYNKRILTEYMQIDQSEILKVLDELDERITNLEKLK